MNFQGYSPTIHGDISEDSEPFPLPDQNNRIVCSGSLITAITKRNQIFHWNKEMHLELHQEFIPLNLYLSLWIHTSTAH
ncbi:hypothetical protein LWI28_003018 [Acer negundo]|uniref:Uncharacterized protein n=1 Tax=Acer negundo TaxID=4023 RepID=A0AAD5IPT2_ACENE|nr:hypothetical protein LWI28_003018 [Acer negundo]